MKKIKSLISLTTAFAVVCSALSLLTYTVFAANDPFVSGVGNTAADTVEAGKVWSGQKATKLAGGTGTSNDPYLISTAEQLTFFASVYNATNTQGKYFKLTNDIYLNEVNGSTFNKTNIWVNNGAQAFGGYFNGDNHTVYGMYLPESANATYAGLIPRIRAANASITNLGISHAEVYSTSIGGLVCGMVEYAGTSVTINNCFANETTKITAPYSGGIIGMIAYNSSKTSVYACCFTGYVSSGSFSGGLIGYSGAGVAGASLSDSYCAAVNDIKAVGRIDSGFLSCISVYSTATADSVGIKCITRDKLLGNAAQQNTTLDFLTTWVVKENALPTLKVFEPKIDADNVAPGDVWSGGIATRYAGGTGISSDPYLISTGEQLAFFSSSYTQANSIDKYYKLTNDIYLNELTGSGFKKANIWVNGGGSFAGHFDGDGHIVYGLYVPQKKAAAQAGLIPVVSTNITTVKNVGVKYAELYGTTVGAIVANVGYTGTGLTLENCSSDGTVILNGKYIGGMIGMVGYNSPKVYLNNCYSSASLTATKYAGGLIGYYAPNSAGGRISYSLAVTPSKDKIIGYSNGNCTFDKVYSVTSGELNGITVLAEADLIGDAATENTELDFNKYWWKRTTSHPQLRDFMNKADLPVNPMDVWDGVIPEGFSDSKSTGAENDPIEISTARDLAFLVKSSAQSNGKYYKLVSNILLNDISDANWKTNLPNEWITASGDYTFKGTFDGNGYAIYGLYQADGTDAGLFSTISGTVKNLAFSNSYLKAQNAGLVAAASSDTAVVFGCLGDSKVTVDGSVASGGMLGKALSRSLEISDCGFYGTVSGGNKAAFVGTVSTGTDVNIIRVLNAAVTPLPIVGTGTADIKESYTLHTAVSGAQKVEKNKVKGEAAKTVLEKLIFENEENENKYPEWITVKDALPTLKLFKGNIGSPEPDYVWDGSIAIGIAEGTGKEKSPYLIKTPAELAYLVKNATRENTEGKYYRLENDIYLNITTDSNWSIWGKTFTPVTAQSVFAGNLDGNGKVIYGLYVPKSAEIANAALFPIMQGGSVKKLGISGGDIYGTAASGAVAATNKDAEANILFEQCFAGADVKIKGNDVGGLLGAANGTGVSFKNCYFVGELDGTGYIGGLIANATVNDTSFINAEGCFVATDNYNLLGANGFYKLVTEPTEKRYLKNCYATRTEALHSYTTEKTGELQAVRLNKMLGEKAKEYMPKLDYENVYSTASGTPVLKCFAENMAFSRIYNPENSKSEPWNGKVANAFDGGNGTVHNPYRISNGGQMALLTGDVWSATSNQHFIITKDIYLNDISDDNWTKTAHNWERTNYNSFKGVLDGCGNTIYGLYINAPENNYNQGLFGNLGVRALVQNLAFSHCDITGKGSVGTLAGFLDFGTTDTLHSKVVRCFGDTTVTVRSKKYAGGFIGATSGKTQFTDCLFVGNLYSDNQMTGGLLGSKYYGTEVLDITGCLVATANNDKVVYGLGGVSWNYVNSYSTATSGGITRYHLLHMQGHNDSVKEKLSGLDFENTWETADGTPVLRIFDNSAYSTRIYIPELFTMSFETNGGNAIKSISSMPYATLDMPKAVRGRDIFEGWYVDEELTLKYPIDYMPEYDITLYAKYTVISFVNSFEEYDHLPGSNGLGTDFRILAPGVKGYDVRLVCDGLRSLERKGLETDDEYVALFNSDSVFENTDKPLQKGKEYTLAAMVYVNSTENKDGKIKLIPFRKYDTADLNRGEYTIAKIGELGTGKWQQISITFVAKTKYVGLSLPGSTNMYLDNVVITPTGNNPALNSLKADGETVVTDEPVVNDGKKEEIEPSKQESEQDGKKGGYWINKTYTTVSGISTRIIVTICVGTAVLAAAGALVIILIVKKKKMKNSFNLKQ